MLSFLLVVLPVVSALAVSRDVLGHSPNLRLPEKTWYHNSDHPVHALFKRSGNDGTVYPQVGSPGTTWSSAYPQATPNPATLPPSWVNALDAAVAAGTIPNISQSHNTAGSNPTYPSGDPTSPEICSATYKCRIPGDIWDAPDGVYAVGFDDGPQPATTDLVNFLQEHNEDATHFMIGINILNYPQEFLAAFDAGGDIAVHTWTHPYMTTLSNLDIVAQLGWTMEIIHNSTGGRVPKFWRPPYGDSDIRVSAIAKQVFGLTTIVWNQDTEDWSLTTGGTTAQAINASMTKWLTGPKSPGLIVLEHELSEQSVGAFISAYPVIKANGWKTQSTAETVDGNAYRNSDGPDSSTVEPANIVFSNTTSSVSNTATMPQSTSTQTVTTTGTTAHPSNPATSQPSSATSLWNHGYLRWALAVLCCVSMTL